MRLAAQDDKYSHILLIPVMTVFLVYLQRKTSLRRPAVLPVEKRTFIGPWSRAVLSRSKATFLRSIQMTACRLWCWRSFWYGRRGSYFAMERNPFGLLSFPCRFFS